MRYRAGSTVATIRADSGSQASPAFAPPVRHDRTPGARSHPQPKTVHARTPAIVRLERPLALRHDNVSSSIWHPAALRIV